MILLVILFIIKLYAHNNIFNIIEGKFGQDTSKKARKVEKIRTNIQRLKADLKFITNCKKEKLIPTFAQPKLSIKVYGRVKYKIGKAIMEAEITNKHKEIKRLKKELKDMEADLFTILSPLLKSAFNHVIRKTINNKEKKWLETHTKKINNLMPNKKQNQSRPNNIVYNFSSYMLSDEETYALSFGLDTHIPEHLSRNNINTEFEILFQDVLKHTKDLSGSDECELKTKLRGISESYAKIKTPYRFQEIIKKLQSNKSIAIVKADKGRAVVILDKTKYIEKCQFLIADEEKFVKLTEDPTKSTESLVQRTLRKLKGRFTEIEYKQLYPSGSRPGKLFGNAKIHKIDIEDTNLDVNNLPLRPIISNIGTATYNTAKYLTKLLSPLGKSEYTVLDNVDFIDRINKKTCSRNMKMVSFDVSNLFTNVPVDQTIEIILSKVYDEQLIATTLHRDDMKELLLLCTKHVPFSFNDNYYRQRDGVAMGSPLGPLFANVFMSDFENKLVPTLANYLTNWCRYVDDIFCFVNECYIPTILHALNSYHPNIRFTCEMENNNTLPFLDILVLRGGNNQLSTKVYRKKSHTNIYINWDSHAPIGWKKGTIRMLVRRAYLICSTPEFLEEELKHLKQVLTKINNYPAKLINNIIEEEKQKFENRETVNQQNKEVNSEPQIKEIQVILPFAGKVGNQLVSKLKKAIKPNLKENTNLRITYTSKKLSSKFSLKDRTKFEHIYNCAYYGKCPDDEDDYVGETDRRIIERVIDHNTRDKKSHLLKHAREKNHKHVWTDDFKILGCNYTTKRRRKVSESLYIQELKPTMNIQSLSYPLKLFK